MSIRNERWARLERRIAAWLPYADVPAANPILMREMRQIDWLPAASAESLARTLRIAYMNAALIGVLVGIGSFFLWFVTAPVLILAVGLFGFISDFFYATFALNAISAEMRTGTWESLTVTALPHHEILAAKYAAIRLRAWRIVSGEMQIRIVTALSMLPFLLLLGVLALADTFDRSSAIVGVLIATWLVGALTLVFEPIWRMRAVTALGLAVSARGLDVQGAALAMFAADFGLRLVQFIVVFGSMAVCNQTLHLLLGVESIDNNNLRSDIDLAIQALALVIGCALTYGYFRLWQAVGMRLAASAAFPTTIEMKHT